MMQPKYPTVLLTIVAMAGCTVGPDYQRPDVDDTPTEWSAGKKDSDAAGPAPDTAWWKALDDPQLTRYVEAATRANRDLAVARARVREARALRRVAGADQLPQATTSGVGRRSSLSETGGSTGSEIVELGVADPRSEFFQASFDASWEIDIFGGNRRAVEAASARLQAAEAQRRGVLLSVVSEVARNYIELRGAQRRLAVAEQNIRIQRDTLAQVRNKHRAGLVPDLDVQQARQQLAQTRAGVPPLRTAFRAASHRLAVLLDRPPAALLTELRARKAIPDPPDIVPTGLPSDLLRRRPDLRAAERRLHAATAEVGVAVARLYPSFSLTGSAGVESDTFSDLFEVESGIWSIGPTVAWPVFQGGRLRGNADAARARMEQARHRYRESVLDAWAEVETALVDYAETQIERKRLADASEAATKALERARALYDKGLTDFLTVLDAERSLTAVEDRLVRSETAVVTRLISLYKALGGGWNALPSSADAGDATDSGT